VITCTSRKCNGKRYLLTSVAHVLLPITPTICNVWSLSWSPNGPVQGITQKNLKLKCLLFLLRQYACFSYLIYLLVKDILIQTLPNRRQQNSHYHNLLTTHMMRRMYDYILYFVESREVIFLKKFRFNYIFGLLFSQFCKV